MGQRWATAVCLWNLQSKFREREKKQNKAIINDQKAFHHSLSSGSEICWSPTDLPLRLSRTLFGFLAGGSADEPNQRWNGKSMLWMAENSWLSHLYTHTKCDGQSGHVTSLCVCEWCAKAGVCTAQISTAQNSIDPFFQSLKLLSLDCNSWENWKVLLFLFYFRSLLLKNKPTRLAFSPF